MLHPDASTLEVLPWRPQTGRVARFYCDITTGEGEPFEQDGRQILRRALQALLEEGYTARVGAKCEFYLFRLDENGDPTPIPHDRAGFLDVAPLDRGENVRRDICLTLEEMGIRPLSSHHEMGPGQNEISIAPADPMTAANHCVTFRNLVGAIAARNGLYADMGPKPLPEENGSGFHINFSLSRAGRSLFLPQADGALSPEAQSFIAGVLSHMPEMTVFCNAASASYARLLGKNAPKGVGWSRMGRGQILRLPPPQGDSARIELRSPDNLCNPYNRLRADAPCGPGRHSPPAPAPGAGDRPWRGPAHEFAGGRRPCRRLALSAGGPAQPHAGGLCARHGALTPRVA